MARIIQAQAEIDPARKAELERYRASEREQARSNDILRLLPKGRKSILEIGALDGHCSFLLADRFESVTALDLQEPSIRHPRIRTAAGDLTALQFEDNTFDCVLCAEVLEHVPGVEKACRELIRVARHEIVIGVPYKQDIRVGRTACQACGKISPPWGHLHSFDERRLLKLFAGVSVSTKSFVGTARERTNFVAMRLMDMAGNPWGDYRKHCVHCGAKLARPSGRPFAQRICGAAALRMQQVQTALSRPHANWIHIVFSKQS